MQAVNARAAHPVPARPEPPLPRWAGSFTSLRGRGAIYVDKTALIADLAAARGFYALSRPRNFGKSLLVSTLATLFAGETEHFRGLALEHLWQDRPYAVLELNFSGCSYVRDERGFASWFNAETGVAVRRISPEFELPEDDYELTLRRLNEWLSARADQSLVVLIDEYDSPQVHAMDRSAGDGAGEIIRAALGRFYALLERHRDKIRFLFAIGVTRWRHLGLAAACPGLQDLSYAPKYAALLGYTIDEIRRDFAPWLTRAAGIRGEREEEILAGIARHYGGFCFDGHATVKVCAPWSVLSFLQDPDDGYDDYWFDSAGRPTLLMSGVKRLLADGASVPEALGYRTQFPRAELTAPTDLDAMTSEQLLCQAGYLAVTACGPEQVTADVPNEEVRHGLKRLQNPAMWPASPRPAARRPSSPKPAPRRPAAAQAAPRRPVDPRPLEPGAPLSAVLGTGTPEDIRQRLNESLRRLPEGVFPMKCEPMLRELFRMLFIGGGIRHDYGPRHGGLRAYLRERVLYLEFQLADRAADAEAAAGAAHARMAARDYGDLGSGLPTLMAAAVYAQDLREIVICEEHF